MGKGEASFSSSIFTSAVVLLRSRARRALSCRPCTGSKLSLCGIVPGLHVQVASYAGLTDLMCTIAAGELAAVRDLQATAQPHRIPETAEAPSEMECGVRSGCAQRQLAVLQHRFNLRRVKFVLETLIDHQRLMLDGEPVLNPGASEMLQNIRQIEL